MLMRDMPPLNKAELDYLYTCKNFNEAINRAVYDYRARTG